MYLRTLIRSANTKKRTTTSIKDSTTLTQSTERNVPINASAASQRTDAARIAERTLIGECLTDAVDARRADERTGARWIRRAATASRHAHAVHALRRASAGGHTRTEHADAAHAADLWTDACWRTRRATLAKHALLTVGARWRAWRRRQAAWPHETVGRDDWRRHDGRFRRAKQNARVNGARVRHAAPLWIGRRRRRRLTLACRFRKGARRARARTVGCRRARLILSTATATTVDVNLFAFRVHVFIYNNNNKKKEFEQYSQQQTFAIDLLQTH